MIRLDTPNRNLQLDNSANPAVTAPSVVVSYSDKLDVSYIGASKLSSVLSTSSRSICDAPAFGAIRDIDFITIQNPDTISHTFTVSLRDSSVNYQIYKVTLATGEFATYTHASGWSSYDVSGALKQTFSSVGASSVTGVPSGVLKGNGIGSMVAATVRTDYAEPTTALATGLLKNTTGTGAHTIAVSNTDYLPPASPSSSGTLTHSGDIVLSGSGKRITGDFSNATVANRVMFQTSTVNGNSYIGAIPNGTGTEVGWESGAYPYVVRVNGAEAMRIDTSQNAKFSKDVQIKGTSTTANGELFITSTDTASEIHSSSTSGVAKPLKLFGSGGPSSSLDVSGSAVQSNVDLLVVAPSGLGYGTGSGGTANQATQNGGSQAKTNTVTLNKPTGQITMGNAALAAGATAVFGVNNLVMGISDIVVAAVATGIISNNTYNVWTEAYTPGSFAICVKNVSGGSLSEAVKINFAIIKGATS